MTYKYLRVRNDIYDKCSDKGMKKLRSGKELKQLFKPLHWYLLISSILAITALCVILIFKVGFWWELIPILIIVANIVISEYRFDKSLDKVAREKELQSLNDEYDKFIKNANEVLMNHGIDTKGKRDLLRNECLLYLDSRNKKFKSFKTGAISQLIGVPVGALISALIYKNSDAVVSQIIAIIIIGFGVIAVAHFIKWITFYTDGYLKDEKLLDILDEIEYSVDEDKLIDKVIL